TALLRAAAARRPRSQSTETAAAEGFLARVPPAESSWVRQLRGDFVRGAGAVLIALVVIAIDLLGAKGRLEVGWAALAVAFAGAFVAEWWKYGLTGRHVTATEVFQDMVTTGLLAASTSSLGILQAPAAWPDLLLLSQAVAATVALVYHTTNAYRLAAAGQHLGAVAAGLIVGTPYVAGGLT